MAVNNINSYTYPQKLLFEHSLCNIILLLNSWHGIAQITD